MSHLIPLLILLLLPSPVLTAPSSGAEALIAQGKASQAAGKWEGAVEAYRKAIVLDPRHPRGYLLLREAYGKWKGEEELIQVLRDAKGRDPKDFISRNLLGVLYAKKRLWQETLRELQETLKIQPEDVDARTNLGWVYSELGRYALAQIAFEEALRLNPEYARAHAGLAGIFAGGEGSYEKAIAEYEKALALDPGNVTSMNDLGWAFYRAGKLNEAEEVLRRALEKKPDNLVGSTNLGWVFLKKGEIQAAAAQFEEAVTLEPTYAFARFGLARALDTLGRGDDAIRAYKEAWRLSKNDLYLLYLAGLYIRWNLWIFLLLGSGLTLVVAYFALQTFRKGV